MKTIFCCVWFALVFILLIGCDGKKKSTKYSLIPSQYSRIEIPDSNKQKYAEFVQKTVASATSNNPSPKNQEEVIEAAEEIADKLYGVPVMDLCRVYSEQTCERVYDNDMTIEKIRIRKKKKNVYGL